MVYFSDIDQKTYSEPINNKVDAKIQPDDLLSITVTSLSPEANVLFNRGALPSIGSEFSSGGGSTAYARSGSFNESYLVDGDGEIDFPIIGKLSVGGLSRNQAKEMLTKRLEEYLKEPIVFIRFLNFRISVIGEVARPSTFTVPTERINILEALGMAGDMTPYGKRESVLVMREEGGIRTITRLNMNSKEVINSPYFYLQQNDVIYVEPDKALRGQVSNASTTARVVQVAASVTSLIIVIITQFFINN